MNKDEKCRNTQVGRLVIHKDDQELRIYHTELEAYLNLGWSIGISDKHRKTLSDKKIGSKPWNLNKDTSEETKQKISNSLKGNVPWNKGLTKENNESLKRLSKPRPQIVKDKISQKNKGHKVSEETRKKISDKLVGTHHEISDETKEKISKSKIGKNHSQETKDKISNTKKGKPIDKDKLKIKLTKEYLTKKKNNSFNSSAEENKLYDQLLKENVNKTIYRNYKCDRYPFYCDFYIKEDDLFIELNAHWTHGGKPFNPEDPDCQKQLNEWIEKAKTSQFYQQAIDTWTVRDVKKRKCAEENNLNYKTIY